MNFLEVSINYTGFGNKEFAQPYFPKIINNDNFCEANSIIQAISALGDKIFKIILNNKSKFSNIISFLIAMPLNQVFTV